MTQSPQVRRTSSSSAGARQRFVVDVERQTARGVSPAGLSAVAPDGAQPGADAAPGRDGDPPAARAGRAIPEALRRGHRRPRRGARGPRHVVAAALCRRQGADRVFLRRVRAPPVASDLCRRARRARRRPLQGGERSRRAARRHRLYVPAGLLSPDRDAGRLAAGSVRAAQLDRRARRAGNRR